MRVNRLQTMETFIIQKGSASLEELAQAFAVSTNTVRRDINELLIGGQIKKVYGGVSAVNPAGLLPMSVRAQRQLQNKQIIGELAGALVPDHATLFLDSGSTTVCVIPQLANKRNITLITHSLAALYEAAKYPELNVISLGGQYSQPTSSYVGASTTEALSRMTVDIVFIAATGISLEKGLTNTTYFEAELKRIVTRENARIILLADHTKFDTFSLFTFCALDRLSAVVTDQLPPPNYVAYFQERGIQLVYR